MRLDGTVSRDRSHVARMWTRRDCDRNNDAVTFFIICYLVVSLGFDVDDLFVSSCPRSRFSTPLPGRSRYTDNSILLRMWIEDQGANTRAGNSTHHLSMWSTGTYAEDATQGNECNVSLSSYFFYFVCPMVSHEKTRQWCEKVRKSGSGPAVCGVKVACIPDAENGVVR